MYMDQIVPGLVNWEAGWCCLPVWRRTLWAATSGCFPAKVGRSFKLVRDSQEMPPPWYIHRRHCMRSWEKRTTYMFNILTPTIPDIYGILRLHCLQVPAAASPLNFLTLALWEQTLGWNRCLHLLDANAQPAFAGREQLAIPKDGGTSCTGFQGPKKKRQKRKSHDI